MQNILNIVLLNSLLPLFNTSSLPFKFLLWLAMLLTAPIRSLCLRAPDIYANVCPVHHPVCWVVVFANALAVRFKITLF